MDTFPLLDRVSPWVLAGFAVLIAVAFVLMAIRWWRALGFVRSVRKDQDRRLHRLRIHEMLDRLGIGAGRYEKKADPVDVERHLWRCGNCPDLGACDAFLDGKPTKPPADFCPNHEELVEFVPPPGSSRGAGSQPETTPHRAKGRVRAV